MRRTTVRTALFFAIAFFCGGAIAEAQVHAPILQGIAEYYAPNPDGWLAGWLTCFSILTLPPPVE
ncbi:MAG TPA: hypothetical protein VF599_05015 [Pyrinomonadaceae bacterium]|jgi:hypothetical protein